MRLTYYRYETVKGIYEDTNDSKVFTLATAVVKEMEFGERITLHQGTELLGEWDYLKALELQNV